MRTAIRITANDLIRSLRSHLHGIADDLAMRNPRDGDGSEHRREEEDDDRRRT